MEWRPPLHLGVVDIEKGTFKSPLNFTYLLFFSKDGFDIKQPMKHCLINPERTLHSNSHHSNSKDRTKFNRFHAPSSKMNAREK